MPNLQQYKRRKFELRKTVKDSQKMPAALIRSALPMCGKQQKNTGKGLGDSSANSNWL
jgi:hypothetical protein